MSSPTLQVVVGSTRPGRVGPAVAEWVHDAAWAHGSFDVELVDLADQALPLFDEPNPPRLGTYVHDHTKAWGEVVSRGHGLVFVNPEYDHGYNAALKNAIDFLYHEWVAKPVAFVSYGGAAGGTRAAQSLKQVALAVKMVPLFEGVVIPSVRDHIDERGVFRPTPFMSSSLTTMLDELARILRAT